MTAFEDLYSVAKGLPIVDWHNHLDMRILAEDRPLGSLYEVWVKADPYKHRAMRICGEPERLITATGTTGVPPVGAGATGTTGVPPVGGNGQDVRCPSGGEPVDEAQKWSAWMRTLPKLVGNPLFAWARMELEWLGLDPTPYLHGRGENISLSNWTPSKMLKAFNVEYISPCVSPSQLEALGQRVSRPLVATDKMSVVPVGERPLMWTMPEVKEFADAQSVASTHFSATLRNGDFHRRNLPHLGQETTLVFVTFRLADSLPQSRLAEMKSFKAEWLREHPEPWDEGTRQELSSETFKRLEKWLDAGYGSCILADPRFRKVVEDALEFYNDFSPVGDGSTGTTGVPPVGGTPVGGNGQDVRCPSGGGDVEARPQAARARYRLHGYVVMPNHVHVLMELFRGEELSKVVQGWKGFSAKAINKLRESSGKVWMAEYYDRLIRNAEHYENTLRYIRKNGEAARWLTSCNGQDVRCPSATDKMSVVPVNLRDASCPSATDKMSVVPVNLRDARCPGGVHSVPSLRMNAGEEVAAETLMRFHEAGCRIVDISVDDVARLETSYGPLSAVAAFAAEHGWTMLLHLGALRETSARLRAAAGPTGGFAGMRAPVDPAAVARFLDRLEGNGQDVRCPSAFGDGNGRDGRSPSGLPRTILLTLNPEAHAQLAVLAGSFVEEGVPGKVQLGPAWWWCDHAEGIRDVLEKQAAYGVLSTFVGMTTDSRSLLSFVRHDYFRRLFCRWVADKVAAGDFPDDPDILSPLVENVCCRNARNMIMGR